MKSLYIALAASMLLAAVPSVGATHTGCQYHPPQEGMAHPTKTDRYLMLTTTTAKLGEWIESNGIRGLQTDACLTGSLSIYSPDTRALVLA